MHISDVEKMRMEKEHKMRHGYAIHDNKRYPHHEKVQEHQYLHKDIENKHARETEMHDMEILG